MFDQWVPDEAEPRRGSRRASLVVRLGGSGRALAQSGRVGWSAASRAFAHAIRTGELPHHVWAHHVWAHAVAAIGAVLVVAAVLLAPARATGQGQPDTMALFRRTGGDLSDNGMRVLALLNPTAALIANRLAPLPPPPEFHASADAGGDDLVTPPVLNVPGMTPDQARLINASIPIASLPNPAAKPFFMPPTNLLDATRAVDCMTAAIYYEAANEPAAGQQAVAQVVLNRMRHPAFPKSVCGVVFQGSNRTTGCQFTFTCDGSLYLRKPSDAGWARARSVATASLAGFVMKDIGNATHYHADYVAPYWSTSLIKVAKIGAHIFYRWTGGWGQPRAFNAAYVGGELPLMSSTGLAIDANLSVTLAPTAAFDIPLGSSIKSKVGADGLPDPDKGAAKIEVVAEAPALATPTAAIVASKPEPKKAVAPAARRDTWSRLPVPH